MGLTPRSCPTFALIARATASVLELEARRNYIRTDLLHRVETPEEPAMSDILGGGGGAL